jgi:hypothetical protein
MSKNEDALAALAMIFISSLDRKHFYQYNLSLLKKFFQPTVSNVVPL